MRLAKIVFGVLFALVVSGCSTVGYFKVPDNTQLYINNRPEPVVVDGSGRVETKPYFWTAAGGVKYRLEKNGDVVKQGKLRAKFRVVSIFWPPAAAIYWPMGLNPGITYDLVNDTQQ